MSRLTTVPEDSDEDLGSPKSLRERPLSLKDNPPGHPSGVHGRTDVPAGSIPPPPPPRDAPRRPVQNSRGLQVPKFLEDQGGLGNSGGHRRATKAVNQPPDFLLGDVGIRKPLPQAADMRTRPRSAEPPEFLKQDKHNLRSRSLEDIDHANCEPSVSRSAASSPGVAASPLIVAVSPLTPLSHRSEESLNESAWSEEGTDEKNDPVAACFKGAKAGNMVKVQAALAKGHVSVSSRNHRNETLLHTAARYGHHELAAMLLSKGADVSAVDGKGRRPSRLAAREGHVDLESLLQGHADGACGQQPGRALKLASIQSSSTHAAPKRSHGSSRRSEPQNSAAHKVQARPHAEAEVDSWHADGGSEAMLGEMVDSILDGVQSGTVALERAASDDISMQQIASKRGGERSGEEDDYGEDRFENAADVTISREQSGGNLSDHSQRSESSGPSRVGLDHCQMHAGQEVAQAQELYEASLEEPDPPSQLDGKSLSPRALQELQQAIVSTESCLTHKQAELARIEGRDAMLKEGLLRGESIVPHTCGFLCDFHGSFEDVSAHEKACTSQPEADASADAELGEAVGTVAANGSGIPFSPDLHGDQAVELKREPEDSTQVQQVEQRQQAGATAPVAAHAETSSSATNRLPLHSRADSGKGESGVSVVKGGSGVSVVDASVPGSAAVVSGEHAQVAARGDTSAFALGSVQQQVMQNPHAEMARGRGVGAEGKRRACEAREAWEASGRPDKIQVTICSLCCESGRHMSDQEAQKQAKAIGQADLRIGSCWEDLVAHVAKFVYRAQLHKLALAVSRLMVGNAAPCCVPASEADLHLRCIIGGGMEGQVQTDVDEGSYRVAGTDMSLVHRCCNADAWFECVGDLVRRGLHMVETQKDVVLRLSVIVVAPLDMAEDAQREAAARQAAQGEGTIGKPPTWLQPSKAKTMDPHLLRDNPTLSDYKGPACSTAAQKGGGRTLKAMAKGSPDLSNLQQWSRDPAPKKEGDWTLSGPKRIQSRAKMLKCGDRGGGFALDSLAFDKGSMRNGLASGVSKATRSRLANGEHESLNSSAESHAGCTIAALRHDEQQAARQQRAEEALENGLGAFYHALLAQARADAQNTSTRFRKQAVTVVLHVEMRYGQRGINTRHDGNKYLTLFQQLQAQAYASPALSSYRVFCNLPQVLSQSSSSSTPRLGAFEVSGVWMSGYGHEAKVEKQVVIYSKLQTALFPSIPRLVSRLDAIVTAGSRLLYHACDAQPNHPVLLFSTGASSSITPRQASTESQDTNRSTMSTRAFWRRRRRGPPVERTIGARLRYNFLGTGARDLTASSLWDQLQYPHVSEPLLWGSSDLSSAKRMQKRSTQDHTLHVPSDHIRSPQHVASAPTSARTTRGGSMHEQTAEREGTRHGVPGALDTSRRRRIRPASASARVAYADTPQAARLTPAHPQTGAELDRAGIHDDPLTISPYRYSPGRGLDRGAAERRDHDAAKTADHAAESAQVLSGDGAVPQCSAEEAKDEYEDDFE